MISQSQIPELGLRKMGLSNGLNPPGDAGGLPLHLASHRVRHGHAILHPQVKSIEMPGSRQSKKCPIAERGAIRAEFRQIKNPIETKATELGHQGH